MTHSALQTSLTAALEFLPHLLFSLIAGVTADKWNRKSLLIWANMMQSAILFAIPVLYELHQLRIVDIYITSFLLATASVWSNATRSSMLPSILPSRLIHQGNSIMQVGKSVATMAGPSIGGVLIMSIPPSWVLAFDALSYLVAGTSLFFIKTSLQVTARKGTPDKRAVLAGLRFVFRDRLLRSSVLIMSISNFANFATFTILVYYGREVLHFSSTWIAIVLGAFGVGLFIGSMTSSITSERFRSGKVMLVSRMVAVLSMLLFATLASPFGLTIASMLNGVWMVAWNVQMASFRQLYIPDYLRGRVTSVNGMIAWSMIPLGSIVGGAMAQHVGCVPVFVMAVGLQGLNLVFLCRSPLCTLGIRGALPKA